MKKTTKAAALLLPLAGVVLLAGCISPSRNTALQSSASPSATSTSTCQVSCGHTPQADHTGPTALALDADALDTAKKTADQIMGAYTAQGKAKKEWFSTLAPMLTTNYAQEAEYIDPARLPVRKITSGPEIKTEVSTGYQVRASFGTNVGDWVIILTRASETSPWLAANILPASEVQ